MIVRDDEYLDFSKVPESRGIPGFLYRIIAVGLLGIFCVGGACVLSAGYGHVWPSPQTQRVDLGQMHH